MDIHEKSSEKISTVTPVWNRRRFLASLGFSAAALTIGSGIPALGELSSQIPTDSNHLVLLADTHCGPNLKHQVDFMRKSISEIVAMNPRPGHVLIYGDFAFLYGKREDYVVLRELMAPLDQAKIPWTTCMGNHDRRDTFTEIFPEHAQKSLLSDRLVFRVETPFVDFLLLDSLIQTNDPNRWITPGEILPDQKEWLHETLKSQTKPVIVGAHHLLDETKIADVLKSHSCVAGYLNGHHHYWRGFVYEEVPALTLPSNGHWGDIGIVNLHLTQKEAVFQLTMRDFLLGNKPPEFEPNPERPQRIAAKQGAIWRLDLA